MAAGTAAHAGDSIDAVVRDGAGREAVEAIARQPEAVREAALLVSTRPDLIVRVESVRSWTSRAFERIVDEQPEAARANLWELVRYPEIIDAMVEPGAAGDVEAVVADHPSEVREAALAAARDSWDAVTRIHALQGETDAAFDEILDGLDPELADALDTLVDEPALMSVLAENLNLTVALGEAFERDPGEVRAEFATLALEVAEADRAERDEWAQSLEDDPVLRARVDEAADEWEDAYGPSYYDDDHHHHDSHVTVIVRPYPYWFGYPHYAADFYVPAAHAHALWYPRSHWGHLGYYYGHGHSLVVFAAPSFPFLYWLRFHFPHHHYYSSHYSWRRVHHVSYWDGYRSSRHHAHQYRQHRPTRHLRHASIRHERVRHRDADRPRHRRIHSGRHDRHRERARAGDGDRDRQRDAVHHRRGERDREVRTRSDERIRDGRRRDRVDRRDRAIRGDRVERGDRVIRGEDQRAERRRRERQVERERPQRDERRVREARGDRRTRSDREGRAERATRRGPERDLRRERNPRSERRAEAPRERRRREADVARERQTPRRERQARPSPQRAAGGSIARGVTPDFSRSAAVERERAERARDARQQQRRERVQTRPQRASEPRAARAEQTRRAPRVERAQPQRVQKRSGGGDIGRGVAPNFGHRPQARAQANPRTERAQGNAQRRTVERGNANRGNARRNGPAHGGGGRGGRKDRR